MIELNKCYNMDCQEGIKQIDNNSVDLIITDPPYSVGFDKKQIELNKFRGLSSEKLNSYSTYVEAAFDYKELANHFYRVLKENTHDYIFCSDRQITKWVVPMKKAGFKFNQLLVWKSNITKFDLTHGHRFPQNSESILFFQKGWKTLKYKRIPKQLFRSCFFYESVKTKENEWHLCPRPGKLIQNLILCSSEENDLILDCFAGSGEHLIQAIKINRKFIGFELSKEFYEKINKRINFHNNQNKLNQFMEVKENETLYNIN